ncbi:MAG: PEP-CTERM sorting domain-containing protein [Planctomycetota bacterium]
MAQTALRSFLFATLLTSGVLAVSSANAEMVIDLSSSNTGARIGNAGPEFKFNVSVDGTGNFLLDSATGLPGPASATVTGSTTDASLFGSSFSVALSGGSGNTLGFHGVNGGFGVTGGANNFRIDGAQQIFATFDATSLPANYGVQLTGIQSDFTAASGDIAIGGSSFAITNALSGSFIDVASATLPSTTLVAFGAANGADYRVDQLRFALGQVTAVPEPSTFGLAALVGTAIAYRRRPKVVSLYSRHARP